MHNITISVQLSYLQPLSYFISGTHKFCRYLSDITSRSHTASTLLFFILQATLRAQFISILTIWVQHFT